VKRQLRQPRVAELVANRIRQQILDGTLAPGSLLPKQEELLEDFDVSLPSMREALRILEVEGLVDVRRGNVGGAIVRVPGSPEAAYTLAMVLQSRAVSLDDVAVAIRNFEPRCAALCAERKDRKRSVLPKLQRNLDASQAALDDAEQFMVLARAFHEELVAGCGNETTQLVVGSLERLWSAQTKQLTERTLDLGAFASRDVREAGLAEHEAIVDCIAAGDAEAAERAARDHYARPERHAAIGRGLSVNAHALRGGGSA
jgi:GntR family transcriptional regulator, transcriptional repressor for pyruvate dehydrogenase complex